MGLNLVKIFYAASISKKTQCFCDSFSNNFVILLKEMAIGNSKSVQR